MSGMNEIWGLKPVWFLLSFCLQTQGTSVILLDASLQVQEAIHLQINICMYILIFVLRPWCRADKEEISIVNKKIQEQLYKSEITFFKIVPFTGCLKSAVLHRSRAFWKLCWSHIVHILLSYHLTLVYEAHVTVWGALLFGWWFSPVQILLNLRPSEDSIHFFNVLKQTNKLISFSAVYIFILLKNCVNNCIITMQYGNTKIKIH